LIETSPIVFSLWWQAGISAAARLGFGGQMVATDVPGANFLAQVSLLLLVFFFFSLIICV
jgi:hypothetical protein